MLRLNAWRRTAAVGGALSGVLLAGCTEVDVAEIGGAAEGEACTQASNCTAGFDCVNDVCTQMDLPGFGGPKRGDCCDANDYLAAFPEGTCDAPVTCPADLACGTQGACTSHRGVAINQPCGLTIDCGDTIDGVRMVCHGNKSVCVDPRDPNPDCGTCAVAGGPFLCKSDGFTPCLPNDGIKDFGEECTGFTDCRRPYICGVASVPAKCEKLPFFPGPDCIESEEESGWFRVYYEIPPETIPTGEPFEFYRLPFPNDIRVINGKISLAGHASPGEVMGIDVTGTIFTAIEQDADGFAINSPIFFRLTDPPTNASMCWDTGVRDAGNVRVYPAPPDLQDGTQGEAYCAGGSADTIYLVDLTPNGGYPRIPVQLSFSPNRGQYACGNLLAIGPLDGRPLKHSTTYAAVLTNGLRDVKGEAPIRDYDFERIIDPDNAAFPPALPAGVRSATDPLREWLAADTTVDAATVVAATVFTTGNPDAIGPLLHDAVASLPAPQFNNDAFQCGTTSEPPLPPVPSTSAGYFPCHGVELPVPERLCGTSGSFREIHGTYDGPMFQSGTRPYLTPADGGAINQTSPGTTGNEVMCYALVLPNGTPPALGWPVIIYGHGTGGNYRGFINKAPTFSGGKTMTELFTSLGFAVIGFDNVMHGPRQDPHVSDPKNWSSLLWIGAENLFFNVINAKAARDNVLQGAVDLFYLTRLLHDGSVIPAGLTAGDAKLDPNNIFYFGHSQGTTIAYPYLVEDTTLKGAILSGAGAELALSILGKKEPVNIADAASAAFADQALTRLHPMMGMLAQMFGPSDAVSWGQDVFFGRPDAGRRPLPLLLFSGVGDSYSPDSTQDALELVLNIPEATAVAADNRVTEASGTRTVAAASVTLQTDGTYDGHFVAFENPAAEVPLTRFLTTRGAEIVR